MYTKIIHRWYQCKHRELADIKEGQQVRGMSCIEDTRCIIKHHERYYMYMYVGLTVCSLATTALDYVSCSILSTSLLFHQTLAVLSTQVEVGGS